MDNKLVYSAIVVTLMLITAMARAHTPPPESRVYFINLTDGAVVTSPPTIKFGIKGFGITAAGTRGKIRHTAGHHHLLLDLDKLPDMDEPIPGDANHIHFDNGETETVLDLPAGRKKK